MERKTVLIIGAGITGLSAAYYVEQKARAAGKSVQVIVLESDDKLGGKVQTERIDGFTIEKGPDSFLARKPAALNLIRELGIDDELVGTNPEAKKTYILHRKKLHRIPQGMNVGVPTQFVPFATTGLLSLAGKVRAGFDFFLPKAEETGDQSLGLFLERRMGKQVVDYLAEPLLAGIYAGDLRNLSLRATFPHLEQLELKYGSLIKGMLAQAQQVKSAQKTPPKPELGARTVPNSVFLTFRTGLYRLIERLEYVLEKSGVQIRLETKVKQLDKTADDRYSLQLDNGETLLADAVVMTTPTYDAAKVLPEQFSQKAYLLKLPYVSVANVVLAFGKNAIDRPLDGSGFVVPRNEGRTITAATWTSSKWLHSAEKGKTLMRFYVGRSGQEEIVDKSDAEIISKVRKDLYETMGIETEPLFHRITRWYRAMPQYTVGHLDRVQEFVEESRKELPGVYFAGSGFYGLGIPDCIDQGLKTAEQLVNKI
ncbi:protoporphyrinogen oxidase [Tumebacillus permanentifrigoris]|uniref:Coproporphyrinogen III oxidase n=1 Tax=Tumebacillus permanentifrigoris TaxID=378543 RepID=A0A316DDD6_9BACL|nr:protoporphyrinogen oxidase [Tumebacillus permanentifrigoris]PWK15985.1 protoporphyrinogen oxidase [Tumebacillus permanentifrigoris]